ncbi:MAG: gamma-glutamyl-gamma-aminobutyrate hydrolase family protein [Anaerolineales bacterium]|nr:gamma-glutamyl-gamma-aminobutyrate hydrolase family protein [Anaerolineales bacterium]
MAQPLIGITAGHGKNQYDMPVVQLLRTYVHATLTAGGTPIIIPAELPEASWQELYQRLDGIIFSGGGDIATELAHAEPHPRVYAVDTERDAIEIALMRLAAKGGKPFLGICRGLQIANIALGGTLYSHVEDQLEGGLKHDFYPDHPRDYLAHAVQIAEDSRLAKIIGTPILEVNSLHHQGVKDVAPALKVTAHAPDGLVEGLELPDHPFGVAVQWHPEWLQEYAPMQEIFTAFVQAASA